MNFPDKCTFQTFTCVQHSSEAYYSITTKAEKNKGPFLGFMYRSVHASYHEDCVRILGSGYEWQTKVMVTVLLLGLVLLKNLR